MYLSEADLEKLRKRIPRGGQSEILKRLANKGTHLHRSSISQALIGHLRSDTATLIIEESLAYCEEHENKMKAILKRIRGTRRVAA
jgi:hypothetical protein